MSTLPSQSATCTAALPELNPVGTLGDRPRSLGWANRLGKQLLLSALQRIRIGRVTLVDGAEQYSSASITDSSDEPGCTVIVRDPRFYRAAAFAGSLGIAEAYIDGYWETDDLPGLIETLTVNYQALVSLRGPMARLVRPWHRVRLFLRRNTFAGSRRNIVEHYDLSNEFFALFLDPSMTYSCAVYENGAATLAEAQQEKIDRACRKLRLRSSDHLLEIGTGWGALAIHAASRYGCRVTTTTISDRQFSLASRRVREAGLSDRIDVIQRDYRSLTGRFDKLVSIEMIEAVGAENYPTFFGACSRLLKPDGCMLLQSIVIQDQYFDGARRDLDFLKKYIFPGSCLPSVRALLDASADSSDLRTWNIEDIGPHYATTLSAWRKSFLARREDVRALGFGERFVRMWDYYFAYCEGAFRARHVGDVQMLLCKPRHRERDGTGLG